MIRTRLAPCKINLTLDVHGARADGFHEIDSLVATFTPADIVRIGIEPSSSDRHEILLFCNDGELPTDARNLAYRAAQAFLAHIHREFYVVEITLDKEVPHQAGLGGGSSDAAAVLLSLAERIPMPAPIDLLAIGAEIGSDVPLFLAGSPIRMQGRGERIEMLTSALRCIHGVIVKPEVGMPTLEAYYLLDADARRVPGNSTRYLVELLAEDPSIEMIGAALHNDFEAPILASFPGIAQVYDAIKHAGAVRALLCGSGAAVFGLARSAAHARQMAAGLTGRYPFVSVARSFAPSVDDES